MKRKLENKKGFTLVEMLACIITLTILGSICTTGINFALKCYQDSVFESESQMLKSTLDLSINDILRYATDVKTEGNADAEGNKSVTGFTCSRYQITGGTIDVGISDNSKNKFVVYNLSIDYEGNGRKEYLLVGNQVYGDNLYIEKNSFKLDYNAATGCFNGEYTIRSTADEEAAKVCKFTCRTISE